MDTTIRNLDEETYRRLKAHAALNGQTIGEALNQAMRAYLSSEQEVEKTGRFTDLPHEDLGEGNEDLSDRVDEILYGA